MSGEGDIYYGDIATNDIHPLFNLDNQQIGEIEAGDIVSILDGKIFYDKVLNFDKKTQKYLYGYYLYDAADNTNIKLGEIDDWTYDAFYTIQCYEDRYFIAIDTGDIMDDEQRKFTIYEFGLYENSFKEIFSNNSYLYATMAILNDNLLFTTFEANQDTILYKYNITTQKIDKLKTYPSGNENSGFLTIRNVAVADNNINLLLLKMTTEDDVHLIIETFTEDLTPVSSYELPKFDDNNNMRQLVADFELDNNYVYYGNFSTTRYLGNIKNQNFTPPMDISKLRLAKPIKKVNDNTFLFCKPFGNELYLFNTKDGSVKTASFYLKDDERY